MLYGPEEDSFLLLSFIKSYAKGSILDLGSGTGILAKEAMKYSRDVLAADINQESVSYCKKQGIKAVKSDLFSNIKGKFDLIIFNPPYLPHEKKENQEHSLVLSGGKKGSEILKRFLKTAKSHLKKNANILIVVSSLTGNVERLFKKYGFGFELLKEEKYFFERLKAYCLSV